MTLASPPPETLRSRLARKPILLVPGVCDALTALLASQAGFEAVYLSGAAIAYTRLARPDIGLTSVSEVADTLALIRDRVAQPIIVDADTGFGNALNTQRTVRMFERAGASALQIEDQVFPKRCGHLRDKRVIPSDEMVGKIKAAVDARLSSETLIIARTDAIAVEGYEAAIARAKAYAEAGADILFVEAPGSCEQLLAIGQQLSSTRPLMANMVEGGQTPIDSASSLAAVGFSMVIFPGGIVRAMAHAGQAFYASLYREGTTSGFQNRMFDFDGLNRVIGTPEMLALGKSYKGRQS